MESRFDDSMIEPGDVILTTKMSDQKILLIHQLVKAGTFTQDEIDSSEYFDKNYVRNDDDPLILSLDLGKNARPSQLEDSMTESLRPDHFADGAEQPQDMQIDLADVDPDAFEFPK